MSKGESIGKAEAARPAPTSIRRSMKKGVFLPLFIEWLMPRGARTLALDNSQSQMISSAV
jgi:hypothetical protein